jgi:hypothetical protein
MDKRHTATRPPELTDPVALRTSWKAANEGGFSARGCELVEVAPGRLEFKPTLLSRAFGIGPLLLGLFFVFGVDSWPLLLRAIGGIVFLGVGIIFTYQTLRTLAFDTRTGNFYSGYPHKKESFPLAKIHALQLVSEFVVNADPSGSFTRFYSYEINLVLKNGRRVNVADHGDLDSLRADADTLANFLEVPVWDAL